MRLWPRRRRRLAKVKLRLDTLGRGATYINGKRIRGVRSVTLVSDAQRRVTTVSLVVLAEQVDVEAAEIGISTVEVQP